MWRVSPKSNFSENVFLFFLNDLPFFLKFYNFA